MQEMLCIGSSLAYLLRPDPAIVELVKDQLQGCDRRAERRVNLFLPLIPVESIDPIAECLQRQGAREEGIQRFQGSRVGVVLTAEEGVS